MHGRLGRLASSHEISFQIHINITATKDGNTLASRRTWLKNVDYPESLAFDLGKNNFARILHESNHGASYQKLKQDEHIMTINLPKSFRFEFELKLGTSDGTQTENIVSGRCSKILLSHLKYLRLCEKI